MTTDRNVEDCEAALTTFGLSKSYPAPAHPARRLWDLLRHKGCCPQRPDDIHALKDVNFSVLKGESVGIVGTNGSGKSTLLQCIAGTLQASAGQAEVSGRIAALLELGSGFNPHFTGRENVYMNAAILGQSREETDESFDRIAGFADIGNFIDQPLSAYSSGMMLRLAFAVQLQVHPDILIIDEALAVGDELFQRKCFAALADFHQRGGTLLFVSHMGSIVKELCDHVLILDRGEVLAYGDSRTTIDLYHRFLFCRAEQRQAMRTELRNTYLEERDAAFRPAKRAVVLDDTAVAASETDYYSPGLVSSARLDYPSDSVELQDVRITRTDPEMSPVNHLLPSTQYCLRYKSVFLKRCTQVQFAMMLKSATGLELGGQAGAEGGHLVDVVEAGTEMDVCFTFCTHLFPGLYYFNCGINGHAEDGNGVLARTVDALACRILHNEHNIFAGYVDLDVEISTVGKQTNE